MEPGPIASASASRADAGILFPLVILSIAVGLDLGARLGSTRSSDAEQSGRGLLRPPLVAHSARTERRGSPNARALAPLLSSERIVQTPSRSESRINNDCLSQRAIRSNAEPLGSRIDNDVFVALCQNASKTSAT